MQILRGEGVRMNKQRISMPRLKEIIRDELREALDHDDAAALVGVVSKLFKAIEAFEEKASPAAINAATPHLGELKKVLNAIVDAPRSYVSQPKKEPQHVSMKAGKAE